MAPLVLYTWLWGRANMHQAVGGGWVKHSRLTLSTWSYVARFEWPRQVGWAILTLAIIYCVGCLSERHGGPASQHCRFWWHGWLLDMHSLLSLQSRRNDTRFSWYFPLSFSRYSQLSGLYRHPWVHTPLLQLPSLVFSIHWLRTMYLTCLDIGQLLNMCVRSRLRTA